VSKQFLNSTQHSIGYAVLYCKNYKKNLSIFNRLKNDSSNKGEIIKRINKYLGV